MQVYCDTWLDDTFDEDSLNQWVYAVRYTIMVFCGLGKTVINMFQFSSK